MRLHRPVTIVTDKKPTYRRAVGEINHRYAPHFDSIKHIDRKWRNNLIEGGADLAVYLGARKPLEESGKVL